MRKACVFGGNGVEDCHASQQLRRDAILRWLAHRSAAPIYEVHIHVKGFANEACFFQGLRGQVEASRAGGRRRWGEGEAQEMDVEEKGAENTTRGQWKIESQSEKKECSHVTGLLVFKCRFHGISNRAGYGAGFFPGLK